MRGYFLWIFWSELLNKKRSSRRRRVRLEQISVVKPNFVKRTRPQSTNWLGYWMRGMIVAVKNSGSAGLPPALAIALNSAVPGESAHSVAVKHFEFAGHG